MNEDQDQDKGIVTIKIRTHNAAFGFPTEYEVARILRNISDKLNGEVWDLSMMTQRPKDLLDINGAQIGTIKFDRSRR